MIYKLWYQQYLRLYKRKIAEKTRESYARIETLIEPVIGEKELEAIKPDDIQAALVVVEETAGSRQAQIAYALLHAAFCRAVRSRHLEQSRTGAGGEGLGNPCSYRVGECGLCVNVLCWSAPRRGACFAKNGYRFQKRTHPRLQTANQNKGENHHKNPKVRSRNSKSAD